MLNIKNLIDAYDWLTKQPGEEPKQHADVLEQLIFNDLIHREKLLQDDFCSQRPFS